MKPIVKRASPMKVIKHGNRYRPPPSTPPSSIHSTATPPPSSHSQSPSQSSDPLDMALKIIELTNKSDGDQPAPQPENVFTIAKIVVTAVDPRTPFGKVFYGGLLVLALIFAVIKLLEVIG